MAKKLISACLLGVKCKYNGEAEENLRILDVSEFIPVCPEQLGGLPTPRVASGILKGTGEEVIKGKCKVVNLKGEDVTKQFLKGAEEALRIAKLYGCEQAVLRDKSPSCGVTKTYQMIIEEDKYKSKIVKGKGVTAALLEKNGIRVIPYKEYFKKLK